jgi:hypothetical protein
VVVITFTNIQLIQLLGLIHWDWQDPRLMGPGTQFPHPVKGYQMAHLPLSQGPAPIQELAQLALQQRKLHLSKGSHVLFATLLILKWLQTIKTHLLLSTTEQAAMI